MKKKTTGYFLLAVVVLFFTSINVAWATTADCEFPFCCVADGPLGYRAG